MSLSIRIALNREGEAIKTAESVARRKDRRKVGGRRFDDSDLLCRLGDLEVENGNLRNALKAAHVALESYTDYEQERNGPRDSDLAADFPGVEADAWEDCRTADAARDFDIRADNCTYPTDNDPED